MDLGTLSSFQNMSFKEIISHPLVFTFWSTTILASIIALGKSLPFAIFERLKTYLTITLTIDESDNVSGFDVFDSFNKWVINHRVDWLSRSFEVDTTKKIQSGQGFQIVVFEKSLFFINMTRREPKGQMSMKTIGQYNIVTAKWNRSKLDRLIDASASIRDYGQLLIVERDGTDTCLRFDYPQYVINQQQLISSKVYNRLSNAFAKFNSGRQSYNAEKLPYKETIMLYGPPGTGKTSLVRHLAAKHNMNLVMVNPESLNPVLVAKFALQSKDRNTKTVILLEDITSFEALMKTEYNDEKSCSSTLQDNKNSLSRFLNTLDGAVPLDNIIIVMTTNHVHKLDSAVYRPGRVDHRICMEYMSLEETNTNILKWSENDERFVFIKDKFTSNQLTANTIMKLRKTTKFDLDTFQEIVDDNESFIQLHEGEEHLVETSDE